MDIGFILLVKSKRKTKYWCWVYADQNVAQRVKDKLYERWDDCPVQKFEDYVETFVDTVDQVQITDIETSELGQSWNNVPAKKINLKQVSGKKMKNGNPDYCEVHTNGFVLDVKLFPSAASKNSHFDLLGSTIQIGKPAALKIVRDLKEEIGKLKETYKEVVVEVLDKEYSNIRICIIKELYRYKIMDIEQSVLLGYIHENTFNSFAGD